jgi:hypothetical protein
MSKINKTGRSKGDARHVRLYEHMEKTAAWRGLSGNAVKAWLIIGLKFNGANNGTITQSSRELGERMGVSKDTAQRAVLELINAGFLRQTRASSFSMKRMAPEYRLTHLRCDVTGAAASREYARRDDDRANVVAFPVSAE